MMKRKIANDEDIIGIASIIAFILPHTSLTLMIVNPLICLYLIINMRGKGQWKQINLYPILAIVISLFVNIGAALSLKSYLSAFSIILFTCSFPFVKSVNFNNKYLYIIFGIIFISQIAYLLNLTWVTNIMNTLYPISWNEIGITNMQDNATWNTLSDFRFGGLYRNPNQCARYLTFILAAYLILNFHTNIRKILPFCLFVLISIILTGSRTGFLVASILSITYLSQRKDFPSLMKNSIILGLIAIFIFNITNNGGGLRGTNIESGFHGSINSKFEVTMNYLSNEQSFLNLLFGHVDYTLFETTGDGLLFFDCDYGYLIYSFGIIGFFAFVAYFYLILRQMQAYKKIYFLLLLWMISSTVVMSFRAYFIFMLFLSIIFSSRQEVTFKRI